MIPLAIAPDLVEEAVLLAERHVPPAMARAFRRERDRIYEVADPDLREAQFQRLALDSFARFGLREALEAILDEHAALASRISGGRIVQALRHSAEGADLLDVGRREPAGTRPLLVVRLRPESLLQPETLAAFLRHELMHIADMLDPAFAYDRILPQSGDGPSADNLLRDRYRVVWDVTIDGRLARASHGTAGTRDWRWREFKAAFAMLGDGCADAFDQWWHQPHPTHAALLAFAIAPAGTAFGHATGRCPICRFPVASLDARVATVTEHVVKALQAEYPAWRLGDGICPQCLDLYEARSRHQR